MGTLIGHLLPGSFFLIWASWWTIQVTWRHLASKRRNVTFINSIYQPLACMENRVCYWPFESVVKIIGPAIGIIGEITAAFPVFSRHSFYWGDIEHATMYSFFLLSGVADILTFHHILPPGTDYCTAALAFAVEGILFTFHLHDRAIVDVKVHQLLLIAIAGCVIFCILELKYQTSLLVILGRIYSVLLQGFWFCIVGLLLYTPPPSPRMNMKSESSVTIVTLIFTWNLATTALFMGLLSGVTRCIYLKSCRKCCIKNGHKYENLTENPIEICDISEEETELLLDSMDSGITGH